MVEEHRHRAGWPKWIILAASAASFAPLAGAQTVSGTGDVQPGPVASPDWVVGGDLIVGDAAAGALTISNGGSVRNDWAFIGNLNGGVGTLTVTGIDGSGNASRWTSLGPVYIGADPGSDGTLRILNGGVAQSESGTLGASAGSVGTVVVSGPGSTWNLNTVNAFLIGSDGKGTLQIDNGGAVRSGQGVIGWNAGSEGHVTVSGSVSAWNPFNNIYVGFDGTGELLVQDGATVHTEATTSPGAPRIDLHRPERGRRRHGHRIEHDRRHLDPLGLRPHQCRLGWHGSAHRGKRRPGHRGHRYVGCD